MPPTRMNGRKSHCDCFERTGLAEARLRESGKGDQARGKTLDEITDSRRILVSLSRRSHELPHSSRYSPRTERPALAGAARRPGMSA
jgi:hypothetical protein